MRLEARRRAFPCDSIRNWAASGPYVLWAGLQPLLAFRACIEPPLRSSPRCVAQARAGAATARERDCVGACAGACVRVWAPCVRPGVWGAARPRPGLGAQRGLPRPTTRAPRRLDRCDPDDVARAWFGSAQRGAKGRRWLAAGARAADGWFRPSGRAPGRSPCGTRVGSAAALDGRQFNPDRAGPVSASIRLRASACGRGARSAGRTCEAPGSSAPRKPGVGSKAAASVLTRGLWADNVCRVHQFRVRGHL